MGDIDTLNSMLIDVAKHLDEIDLKQMQFMCKDIVKRRDMEKVKGPLDLFTELQTREKITRNDTSFLKQLLLKCEKPAAVKIVEQFENPTSVCRNEIEHQVPQAQPVPHPQHHGPVTNRREDPVVAQQLNLLRKEFIFLTKHLGRDWKFFMRELGMEEVDMESVQMDCSRNLRDQIYQALVLWVRENKDKATKAELISALRDVQRNDLASKLENGKY